MTETFIPFGIHKPGPADKAGYAWMNAKTRSLDLIEFVVYHSLEGWRGAVMDILNGPRRVSWLGTILLDGTLWNHYPLEAPTWTSGSIKANIRGAAWEFEGVKSSVPTTFNIGRGPITDPQVKTGALIFKFLQGVAPNLGVPRLPYGFQEHRILTSGATECPSGRIRWTDIAAELGGDMPLTQDDKDWIDKRIKAAMGPVNAKGHERGTKINDNTDDIKHLKAWQDSLTDWLKTFGGD